MARERKAAQEAIPVRPVPSLDPRDPAVDAPDYILISRSLFEDLLHFISKRKVKFYWAILALLGSPFSPFLPSFASYPAPFSYFVIISIFKSYFADGGLRNRRWAEIRAEARVFPPIFALFLRL